MRNHRNSVGMTMINSTKQVNKVKPNVNRATNDSLSSPNQPYNQRYLIIRSTLQFIVTWHIRIHMWSLTSYIRRYSFIHDHCWLEYSIIHLFCTQSKQYKQISLLRINKKTRSGFSYHNNVRFFNIFFISLYGKTWSALDIWYRHVFSKQWELFPSLYRLNVNIFLTL